MPWISVAEIETLQAFEKGDPTVTAADMDKFVGYVETLDRKLGSMSRTGVVLQARRDLQTALDSIHSAQAGARLADVTILSSRDLRSHLVRLALRGDMATAQQDLNEWAQAPGHSLEALARDLGQKRDILGILPGDLIIGNNGGYYPSSSKKFAMI